jgi:hypothetical protein
MDAKRCVLMSTSPCPNIAQPSSVRYKCCLSAMQAWKVVRERRPTLEVLGVRRCKGALSPTAAHKLDERQECLGFQEELLCRLGLNLHPGLLCLHVGDHIGPGRKALLFICLGTCAIHKP